MEQNNNIDLLFLTAQEQMRQVEEILAQSIEESNVPLIKEATRHIIQSGGKRFRPALAILSAKACGYSGEVAGYLGAAIELLHTASIIHDDVLDGADLRRGVVSANAKWGNHLSILVGDYCLSIASNILASRTNQKIISILANAIKKTTEGEILEVVYNSDLSINIDTYMKIIRLKTAHLIAASCEAGSCLAEASPRLSAALSTYGMNVGTAFQIVDDILDYTIDSTALGKRRGTDLKEGKLTLPVICALNQCSKEEKEIIKESLITLTYSAGHFESVIKILEKYGCIRRATEIAEKNLMAAIDSLSPFKPSLEKEALVKFASFVANRKN